MENIIKMKIPTFVLLPRKTKADVKWQCSMNVYRNANFRIIAQAKIIYKEFILAELEAAKKEYDNLCNGRIPVEYKLTYIMTTPSKRRWDLANYGAVVGKFAEDCLVDYGIMKDDSWEYLTSVTYKFGGITKGERTCMLEIEPVFPDHSGEMF